MNKRTALIVLGLALVLALLAAPTALAAAGGGSAGFSGGGGGGGGGSGAGLFIVIEILIRIAVLGHGLGALLLFVVFLLWLAFTRLGPAIQAWWGARQARGSSTPRKRSQRERRIELAAAEAAEDDPAFAPDRVREQATKLFVDVQAAWDRGDRSALKALVGPDLMVEWSRRLDGLAARGWSNRVQPLGPPKVEYVSLQHRGGPDGDRVVVRIDARVRDYVVDTYGNHLRRSGQLGEVAHIKEFWTLAKRGDRWVLQSIEQGAEGAHALNDEIVATPWHDEQGMRDEALVEGAVAEALPDGTAVAEVADLQFTGTAKAAAMDLSVADGRFNPDVLEVAARRAVTAWADAVDGSDDALFGLAHGPAARELLHPGDPSGRSRLVVRGPNVKQIRIAGLDAAAQPPTMTIDVDVSGKRYIEDRDTTAVLAGSKSRETTFTEHWTMALDGDDAQPWRIVSVAGPLARA